MKYLQIIREILTILSIISAAVVAFPFVKKKILDQKLQGSIEEIDQINKKNIPIIQKEIEKYIYHDNDEPISIRELQKIYISISNIKMNLYLSQGEIATLAISLEGFIRRTLHWYKQTNERIYKNQLYAIVLETLEDIYYLMLKNIPTPANRSTKSIPLINKSLRRYSNNTSLTNYNGFEIGQIHDVASSVYPIFYSNIYDKDKILFFLAAYDVFNINIKYFISRLLTLHEMYAPVMLEYKMENIALAHFYLLLVGFSKKVEFNNGDSITKLFYMNPVQHHHYLQSINKIGLHHFNDTYLKLEIPLDNSWYEKKIYHDHEIIEISIKTVLLEKYFKRYKNYILNKLIREKKGDLT